jgi:hypothetical protein
MEAERNDDGGLEWGGRDEMPLRAPQVRTNHPNWMVKEVPTSWNDGSHLYGACQLSVGMGSCLGVHELSNRHACHCCGRHNSGRQSYAAVD